MNSLKRIIAILMVIIHFIFSAGLPTGAAAFGTSPLVDTNGISDTETVGADKEWQTADKVVHDTVYEKTDNDGKIMSDEDIVDDDYNWLTYWLVTESDFGDQVTSDLNCPSKGEHGSSISWASSDETVVATDGTVTRPTYIEGDTEVTLTATITYGEEVVEKTFYITVIADEMTSAERVALDKEWLTEELVLNGNCAHDVKVNLYLPELAVPDPLDPEAGGFGSTISWTSSDETVVATDGTITRPTRTEEDVSVTLTATISDGDVQDEKAFAMVVTPIEAIALKFDDFSNFKDKLQFNGEADITATQDRHDNSVQALQFINDGQGTGGSVFTGDKLHLDDDLSFSTTFTYCNA